MMDKEQEFGKKIAGYLDKGAGELKAGTVYRLQLARQQALARIAETQRVSDLSLAGAAAGAGSASVRGGRGFWASSRLWLGIAVILAAGFGYQQWQAYQQLNELEETDLGILSSDLPIDAYLDRGFQNWLKHASDE